LPCRLRSQPTGLSFRNTVRARANNPGRAAQADLFSEVAILERLRPSPSVSRLLSYGVEADSAVRPRSGRCCFVAAGA